MAAGTPEHESQPDWPALLRAQQQGDAAHLDTLQAALRSLIEASASSNADDEHDPEGSTIAFERAQLQSLLEKSKQRLIDIEAALFKLENGSFGRCESCGDTIEPARLAARPAARSCLTCAGRARR